MTQPLRKLVTFEEFALLKPENGRYELHDGVIVKMPQPFPLVVVSLVDWYWYLKS